MITNLNYMGAEFKGFGRLLTEVLTIDNRVIYSVLSHAKAYPAVHTAAEPCRMSLRIRGTLEFSSRKSEKIRILKVCQKSREVKNEHYAQP